MGWRAFGRKWAEVRPLARAMRRSPTPAEKRLWALVRKRQLGPRFRRQYVIRGFIVDFYCPEKKLAVEVDGAVHLSQAEADAQRDHVLALHGCRVVRVRNEDVLHDTERVIARIKAALAL